MREQKEDGEILVDYCEDLIDNLNQSMNDEWYHIIAVSFFYNQKDENGEDIIKNEFQIYYQTKEDGCYFDLLEDALNNYLDEKQEIAIKKVKNTFESFHKYCSKCEDNWTTLKFDLYNEDKFEVDYSYDDIQDIDKYIEIWKIENNVI